MILRHWAELTALVVFIIGLGFTLNAQSALISYVLIFIFGLIGGRFWYHMKHELWVPIILIIVGFLLGYVMGTVFERITLVVVLFVFGIIISYMLHDRNIISSIEY